MVCSYTTFTDTDKHPKVPVFIAMVYSDTIFTDTDKHPKVPVFIATVCSVKHHLH